MKRAKVVLRPAGLQALSRKMFKIWLPLKEGAERDPALKVLADKARELALALSKMAGERELEAARVKDRRLGPLASMWEVFIPDALLGMNIVRRTQHVRTEQRKPTWWDMVGALFFPSKEDLERYKPRSTAAEPGQVWSDLDTELHAHWNWQTWDRRLAALRKRTEKTMPAWGKALFV